MSLIHDFWDLLDRHALAEGWVLSPPRVEALAERWCEEMCYDYWRVRSQCERMGYYRDVPWIFNFELGHGHFWQRRDPVDLELEFASQHCLICWRPLWRTNPQRSWRVHCGRRWCRTVMWYFYEAHWWRPPHATPEGALAGPYLVAEFIKRMCAPKSKMAAEFSKRYAHRKVPA